MSSDNIFIYLKVLPIKKVYIYRAGFILFKNKHSYKDEETHSRSTRYNMAGMRQTPSIRLALFSNSFLINSIRIYNHFVDIIHLDKIGVFKKKLFEDLSKLTIAQLNRILIGNYST
jgi:hypothetical protein